MRELDRIEAKTAETKNIIDEQIRLVNENIDIIDRIDYLIEKLDREYKQL